MTFSIIRKYAKKLVYSIMLSLVVMFIFVGPVFAQVDPTDPLGDPGTVSVTSAIYQLYALGVLPVIVLAAVLAVALIIYKRFRK